MPIKILYKDQKRLPKSDSTWLWWQRGKFFLKIFAVIILGLVVSTSLILWFFWDEPLASPINSLTTFRFLQESRLPRTGNKVVYGFLPYWNMDVANIQKELSHLSYFSLTIDGAGKLITKENDYAEPGYNKLRSDQFLELSNQAIKQKGSVELTITQFNGDDIYSFLSSEAAQQQLFDDLDGVILAYPFSGINIDIEPAGSGSAQLQDKMTNFVENLNHHLDSKYDDIKLSIDVYAGAANGTSIWNMSAIEPHVDYIIVMAYDFHRRSSITAGPVAPLFGGKDLWDSDINQHLQTFVQQVPPQKILLGIPFYGYEWQTTSRDAQSNTYPDTGRTASIDRVSKLMANKEELFVEEHWNEDALSPYLSYEEDGETYVIYYENSRSISYKLDYVNQLDLGGIAIWALGYEGESRELWDVIERKIR